MLPRVLLLAVLLPVFISSIALAFETPSGKSSDDYILGPGDQFQVWAIGAEELSDKTFRVDPQGTVDVPLIGQLHVGGRTVELIRKEMNTRLKEHLRDPQVSISVTQYQSQPVSVVGAVNTPGIQYLQGRKTLLEVLSLSGGLRPDAGSTLTITRKKGWGTITAGSIRPAESADFTVAEIKLKSLLAGERPQDNVAIMPHDVVLIPRAEMVYVIGEVRKSGGFVLNENSASALDG
jgi:polysaccharide export outer membrane protein